MIVVCSACVFVCVFATTSQSSSPCCQGNLSHAKVCSINHQCCAAIKISACVPLHGQSAKQQRLSTLVPDDECLPRPQCKGSTLVPDDEWLGQGVRCHRFAASKLQTYTQRTFTCTRSVQYTTRHHTHHPQKFTAINNELEQPHLSIRNRWLQAMLRSRL